MVMVWNRFVQQISLSESGTNRRNCSTSIRRNAVMVSSNRVNNATVDCPIFVKILAVIRTPVCCIRMHLVQLENVVI